MATSEDFIKKKFFSYDENQLSIASDSMNHSMFDKALQSSWVNAMNNGCFNYKIQDLKTKVLPSKFGFIVQLNIKRATERRKPFAFSKIIEPFNDELFNFKKIKENEILFELQPKHWKDVSGKFKHDSVSHLVIINSSPLEFCHSLLVPYVHGDFPQVLTFDCLRLAVEIMLLSNDHSLRMGFNSIGAFASINHLHFHLYCLKDPLFLETAEVNHLSGECYEIKGFPSEGFAFQLMDLDVVRIISAVMKLVSFLIEKNIAYNVFITRGSAFLNSDDPIEMDHSTNYQVIRIYVWARYFFHGAKDDYTFNPAVCELAGHIPVKSEKFYTEITEDDVAMILRNACHDIFVKVREDVKQLFL